MTDSMKFGPEWLRNMSADPNATINSNNNNNTNYGNNNSLPIGGNITPPARNLLAEFRYGREEMLALFERNCPLPELLPSYKSIYVEKIQCPLALTPSTEDELVSTPVISPLTRSSWLQRYPLGFSSGPGSAGAGCGSTRGNGRGGVFERGRGRGGKSNYSLYSTSNLRSTNSNNFEESGVGFLKERLWNERNGGGSGSTVDGLVTSPGILNNDWNNTPNSSPRKEYSSHSRNVENWRKNREDFHVQQQHDSECNEEATEVIFASNASTSSSNLLNLETSSGWRAGALGPTNNYRWGRSSSWRDDDAHTPAITNEPTSSGGGTVSGGNNNYENLPIQRSYSCISTDRSRDIRRTENHNTISSTTSHNSSVRNGSQNSNNNEREQQNLPEWAMENTLMGGTFDATGAFQSNNKEEEEEEDEKQCELENTNINEEISIPPRVDKNVKDDLIASGNTGGNDISLGAESKLTNNVDLMLKSVADDMIEKLIMDNVPIPNNYIVDNNISEYQSQTHNNSNDVTSYTGAIQHEIMPHTSSTINKQPTLSQQQSTTSTHNESELWFYRDPQSKIQGPFSALEMIEWYRAGYFNEQLYVRRVCDQRFRTLGDLIKLCHNQIPFQHSHLLPPTHLINTSLQQTQDQLAMTHEPSTTSNISEQSTTVALQLPTNTEQLPTNPHQDANTNQKLLPQSSYVMSHDLKLNVTAAADSLGNAVKNLNAVDMSSMLNLHFQMLQKQYQRHQELIVLTELSKSECFQRLLPAEKEAIVQQKVFSLGIPDYLTNLTGLSTSLAAHNPSAGTELHHVLAECNKKTTTVQSPSIICSQMAIPQQLQQSSSFINQNDEQKFIQQHYNNHNLPPQPMPQQQPLDEQHEFMQMWSETTPTTLQQQQGLGQQRHTSTNPWTLSSPLMGVGVNNMVNVTDLEQQHIMLNNLWSQQQQQQQSTGNAQQHNILTIHKQQPQTVHNQHIQQQAEHDLQQEMNLRHQSTSETPTTTTVSAIETQLLAKQLHNKQNQSKLNKNDPRQEQSSAKKQQVSNTTVTNKHPKSVENNKKQQQQQQLKEENRRRQQKQQLQKSELEEKERQQQRRKSFVNDTTPTVAPTTMLDKPATTSIAPWSTNKANSMGLASVSGVSSIAGVSFVEIQKSERRERQRLEQQQRQLETQVQQKQQLSSAVFGESVGWNAQTIAVKSLTEIQAEEAKRFEQQQQQRKQELIEHQHQMQLTETKQKNNNSLYNINVWLQPPQQQQQITAASILATGLPTSSNVQKNNAIKKSQTVTTMQTTLNKNKTLKQQNINPTAIATPATTTITTTTTNRTKSDADEISVDAQQKITKNLNKPSTSKQQQKSLTTTHNDLEAEFTNWCTKSLNNMQAKVDVPTFVTFLQDLESPFEIKDYIRMYLGESKEFVDFAKHFLERRSKCRNLQRAQNAHIDDMCKPAPAITPSVHDNSEKGKLKKHKKKMMKLDARILGFSVTAAAGRINVGDRDYVDAP